MTTTHLTQAPATASADRSRSDNTSALEDYDERAAALAGRAAMVAGICLALFFPILMAAWPAAGVQPDQASNASAFLPFISNNRALFTVTYVNGIVMHLAGILAVLGVYRLLKDRSPWTVLATAGGLVWMVLDIAYNGWMLHAGPEIADAFRSGSSVAGSQWELVVRSAESLQFTGHLGAGLWLVTTGVVALRRGGLPRPLAIVASVAGVLIGLSFFVPEALYPCFMLLPIWFIWSGRRIVARSSES